MSKDYIILADHILESIVWIEAYTKDMTEGDFSKNIETQDAVIRRLAIIGEAISNFPPEIKKEHPDIRWNEISGMRNLLIHEYFGVSISLVWNVVKKDIPVLKKQIKKIKKN